MAATGQVELIERSATTGNVKRHRTKSPIGDRTLESGLTPVASRRSKIAPEAGVSPACAQTVDAVPDPPAVTITDSAYRLGSP